MRRLGRLRLVAVLAAVSLAAVGCGDDGGDTTEPAANAGSPSATEEAAGSDVRVGLAYDVGGRGDKSFNDSAAAGLERAKAELGVEFRELSPNTEGTDRGERLRLLAESGFNPVIAVGFAYAEPLKEIAPQFPDTKFAIIDDSSVDADNVTSLVFAEEQASFLVGAAAALKTQSDNVGFIGGVQVPLLEKFQAGFEAGVAQIDPNITVQAKYLTQPPDFSGFNAPDRGRAVAQGMYDAGADIVFAAAGGSGNGVFEAAKAAGAKAIGVDSDQYESADPAVQDVILTSALKRVDVAVFEFIQDFVNGETEPGVKRFDLSLDGVGFSTSGGQVDDIADQLNDLKQQIIDGQIKVPTTPQG